MKPKDAGDGPQVSRNGKVSLIIRVHNSERYLVPCIESALDQTYENMEIIAVNDGSTDSSLEILKRYSDRIKVVNTRHGGHAAAYNVGIANMTGEWFTSLDSDDVMYPDAIEQKVRAGERLGSSSLTKVIPFFDYQFMGVDGRPTGRTKSYHMNNSMSPIEQGASMLSMFFGNPWASIIHRSILGDVGGFDGRYGRREDLEFNIRLTLVHGYRFNHVPKIIYKYRVHPGQTNTIMERMNIRRMIQESIIDRLDGEDRKEYEEFQKRRFHNARILTVCRRADHALSSFIYDAHDSKVASIVAARLRALSINPLLCDLVDALTYRMCTVKIKPRRDKADDGQLD